MKLLLGNFAFVFLMILTGCSVSSSSLNVIESSTGEFRVIARDLGASFRKRYPDLSQSQTHVMFVITPLVEKQPGDPGYRSCYPALRDYDECLKENNSFRVSRSRAIAAATSAIQSSAKCSWDGFDTAYDARQRRGLAERSDNRVLFAALNCR